MKKTRLLEIIREEIAGALNEAGLGDQIMALEKQKEAVNKQKLPLVKKESNIDKELADLKKKQADEEVKSGAKLEEDQLNEMAYNIVLSNPTELAKLKDKIKDSTKKGEQLLSQVIDIIQRDKKEDKPIRQRDIANELGTIQQKINPLVNLLIDYGILSKGESVTGVTKKTPSDKPKKEKPASTGAKGRPAGSKKATLTPGDDGFDKVTYSDNSDEEIEDTYYNDEDEFSTTDTEGPSSKEISSDETAKELGSTPEEKKAKFNQFLASVKKNKEDKAKIDGILKLAKEKIKFPKSMMDDLKRAAGRSVE